MVAMERRPGSLRRSISSGGAILGKAEIFSTPETEFAFRLGLPGHDVIVGFVLEQFRGRLMARVEPVIFDGHNDILSKIDGEGGLAQARSFIDGRDSDVDLPKARAGGFAARGIRQRLYAPANRHRGRGGSSAWHWRFGVVGAFRGGLCGVSNRSRRSQSRGTWGAL